MIEQTELIAWLETQEGKFEQALTAREQMERRWRSGSSKAWRAAGCRLTREQRIKHSDAQRRIGQKCRHDLEMCRAALHLIRSLPAAATKRPCPNPACCGTGTVEIRNGPHVKKCGVCKGTGFFPITGL